MAMKRPSPWPPPDMVEVVVEMEVVEVEVDVEVVEGVEGMRSARGRVLSVACEPYLLRDAQVAVRIDSGCSINLIMIVGTL